MNIQNPHDRFFKETLGKVEVAKDFLNNYLPSNIMKIIDINTLEPQKDSFINDELKEAFSDLLYRVNIGESDGYIYFLFEHKSFRSEGISFQLLKYMIEIWETKTKKEKINELPVIIPLIIYQWKDVEQLIEQIDKTYPEGSKVVMTLADKLREEGWEKGLEKGLEKGSKQTKIEFVRKLIIKGFSTDDIVELAGVSKEEIEEMRKSN